MPLINWKRNPLAKKNINKQVRPLINWLKPFVDRTIPHMSKYGNNDICTNPENHKIEDVSIFQELKVLVV